MPQEPPHDRQGRIAALVADLDDDTAAEVLAYARWLLEEDQAPAPDERPRGTARPAILILVIVLVLVICGAVSVLRWLGL